MTKLGIIKPMPQQPPVEQTIPQQAGQAPVDTSRFVEPPAVKVEAGPGQLGMADTIPNVPEDSILVETNLMKAVLTNYGGGPVSLELKNFIYKGDGFVQMLPDCRTATPEFKFNEGTINVNKYVYIASAPKGNYAVTQGTYELTYTYVNDKGASIVKKYRFYADRYDYDLIFSVTDPAGFGFERKYAIEWNNRLDPTETTIQEDYSSMWAMALQADVRVKFDSYKNDMFKESLDGATSWIATRSKYFTSILVPRSRLASAVKASGVKNYLATAAGKIETRELAIGMVMEAPYNEPMTDSFSVFVGPMDYDILKSFNGDVVDLIDIGTTPFVGWIIKIFAIPIMWILPRMYSFIPNYGWVIVVFSLLVKVITWPLSKKSVQSMNAMREIQPQMEELKKKHKNNPQALNREIMALYKKSGINPLSGCLPMLAQMPLFFALFAVFRSTILLRQAPFMLWWDDLSRGAMSMTDPYIILVILMVVLMFVQQKMAMTDPKNKIFTYIFPLILGFAFYKASAGLVLYWTCFSLFSFAEQIIFKKKTAPPAVQVVK